MIFHDVKLPNSISLAREKRDLVIFVGAGISCPPPSSFPLFSGLVEQVGKKFGLETKIEEIKDREPQKLEEWNQPGRNIHAAVASILRNPTSKPTQLHLDLIKVFPDVDSLRIVTTNFDKHLSTAAKKVFPSNDVEEYFAPALPLGDDFSGIVYLHGSAFMPENRMVLTASDFGKAYFSKGWAREFLLSLFSKYTVFFVGYSHSDVLVSFLAHGIKHAVQKERWSLISSDSRDEDKDRWEGLGINVETYPLDCRDSSNPHHILSDFFHAWTKFLKQTLFERINSLRLTIESGIPDDPASIEFLDYNLKDTTLTQEICNSIGDPKWIDWMDSKGYFQSFFNDESKPEDRNKPLATNEAVLGDWLCSTARIKFGDELLTLFERHHCDLNNDFAYFLAQNLWQDKDATDDPYFNVWVELLIFNHTYAIPPVIWAFILRKCNFPDNAGVGLKILEHITSPRLILKKAKSFSVGKETGVKICYDIQWPEEADHLLNEIWESVLRPAIPQWGTAMLEIFIQQLTYAHLLLRESGNKSSDITSRQRKSIEPDDQNRVKYNICLHFLVDAIREILIIESKIPNNTLHFYIDRWSTSGVPLLIRFSIYALGLSKSVSDDLKIEWLIEKRFLFELGFKKEVFDVLKRAYPNVNRDVRIALIDAVNQGQKDDGLDYRIQSYAKYNILVWLRRADENCEDLNAAINKVKVEFPEFTERERPEFDIWTSGAYFVDPTEGVDFSKILSEPSSNYLRLMQNPDRTSFTSDFWGLSKNLKKLFEKDREWAEDFVDELQTASTGVDRIWGSTFSALSEVIKDEDDWRWILGVIETLPESPDNFLNSVEFVSRNLWSKDSKMNQEIVERCYSFISKAWDSCRSQETESGISGGDSLDTATNHLGGMIGEFWIHYASYLRHEMESDWIGLPDSLKEQLNQAIEGKSKTEIYARIAIVPWATHLFAWDREFAIKHIIPLFDWDIGLVRAKQTWAVYMSYQRMAMIGMERVLIPHYVKTVNQLNLDSDWEKSLKKVGALHYFGFQIAGLFIHVEENPMESGLAAKLIPHLPEEVIGAFVLGIGDLLKALKPGEQEEKWNVWISEFLENRLKGIPRNFTESELKHLPTWSLYLNDLFPEMVSFLEKLTLKDVFAYRHITEIPNSELLERFPEDACKFCVLVLKAEDYSYLHKEYIEILEKFNQLIPESDWLKKYQEELYRRGWKPDG